SVISLVCTLVMARTRKGKPVPKEYQLSGGQTAQGEKESTMSPLVAFLPFILIFVLLLVTSKLVPPVNSFLAQFSSSFKISTSASAGMTSFSWVNTPGVMIFVAAIIGGIVQKASGKLMWQTFVDTLKQMS